MSQQPATEPRNSQELTGTTAGKYRWDTWNGNGSQNPGLTWGMEAATVKHRPKAGSEPRLTGGWKTARVGTDRASERCFGDLLPGDLPDTVGTDLR